MIPRIHVVASKGSRLSRRAREILERDILVKMLAVEIRTLLEKAYKGRKNVKV